ncbi:MAG: hypothetical protein JWN65_584 [Solirubrobacterales bacterium]|nr:hypothetical protein [Solirubrobacterales bacterium]
MGRRSRRRAATPNPNTSTPAARDHQARVKVTDDVWRDFRTAAGERSVAVLLGELVDQEVTRHRIDRAAAGQVTDAELVAALEDARLLRDEIAAIADHLERRAPNLTNVASTDTPAAEERTRPTGSTNA